MAINAPEEQEKVIIDTAQEVSKQLYFHPDRRCAFEFYGEKYRCGWHTRIENFKKMLYFIAFNMKRPTTPIVAQAEVGNDLTELENLRGTIAAFLRNRLGKETVGILDEEEETDG